MKLPISWLKRYIHTTLSPDKLAERLTMSGTAVERIENKFSDSVLEIEVTTNRPDCLSILGLAREVSALTGQKVTPPKINSEKKFSKKNLTLLQVEVREKKACPSYTARLIQALQLR